MPQVLNPQDKTENVILSPDLFSALLNDSYFGSVRALEPIPRNGVYFYEVKIVLPQVIGQFGWATKQFFMANQSNDGVGDDPYSIGFDASYRRYIWHKTEHSIEDMPEWHAGDIVGCLIDVPGKNFIFYLNGREFNVRKLNIDVHFSDLPYYPAASFQLEIQAFSDETVGEGEHAHFNFGQQPFHYPPKNIEFNDFYGYRFNRYHNQALDSSVNCSSREIELSIDCFSAHNTSSLNNSIETVFALKTVTGKGVYFYEVNLLTDGLMKIGWTVGRNKSLSIGFDGYRRLIWHNEKQQFNISAPCWKVGDVLGCLIDVPEQNFIFYHNGKEFDLQQLRIGINFKSNDKYRPAVELSAGQQVYCNFGQERFRFGPSGIEYQDFYGNRFDQALQEI